MSKQYCKYCYTTHADWDFDGENDICGRCGSRTAADPELLRELDEQMITPVWCVRAPQQDCPICHGAGEKIERGAIMYCTCMGEYQVITWVLGDYATAEEAVEAKLDRARRRDPRPRSRRDRGDTRHWVRPGE